MVYYVGDTITEGFSTGTAGETFTVVTSEDPDDATFLTPASFEDLGSGSYRVSFDADLQGQYYARWTSSVTAKTFEGNWDVDARTVVSTGTSRLELRRRIGGFDGLGDMLLLTATDGTTGTVVDDNRIFLPTNAYRGREIYVATGANAGEVRKVSGNTEGTHTIEFNPELNDPIAIGDEVELWNTQGQGFHVWEVHDVINGIIADARSGFWIPQLIDIVDEFDSTDPVIEIPATLNKIFAVEWQDASGYWHDVLPASYPGGNGWYVEAGVGRITVGGTSRSLLASRTLRVRGYGDLPPLNDDNDVTPLNAEWLVKEAVARLLLAGIAREPVNQVKYPAAQRRADQARPIAQGRPAPNTVLIGAA